VIKQLIAKFSDKESRSSLYLVGAQLSFTLTILFVDIFLARKVSEVQFGYWKQFMLAVNVLVPMFAFGLPEGYKYFSALEEEKENKHFWNVTILLSCLGIVLFIIFFFLGGEILNLFTEIGDYQEIVLVIPVLFVLLMLSNLFRFRYINHHSVKDYFIGFILGAICYLIIFGAFHFKLLLVSNFTLFISCSFLGNHLVKVVYFLVDAIKSIEFNITVEDVKRYLSYGIPLFVSSFIAIITLNTDKTIVSKFSSIEDFALFSIGAKEVPLISLVSTSFAQAIFPSLVKAYADGNASLAKSKWINLTKKISIIVYPIILILMIGGEYIVVYLFGDKYLGAVPIFKVYLLVILWRNNYYGGLLAASGKTKWITFYGLLAMLFNLGISYFFYQMYGPIGVAYGTLITVSFVNILQMSHEKILLDYTKDFLLRPEILLLIGAIISSFLLL